MEASKTITNIPFTEASTKNWFLSTKPASPKQTLSVAFENGKSYKYLGTSRANAGDPVIIDWGGATSYCLGNVDSAENGITVKRSRALKPLFVFSTDPDKTEIKYNGQGMNSLEEVEDIESYFHMGYPGHEDLFRITDYLVSGVLNAITVLAFPAMSKPEKVEEAKAYLRTSKHVPILMFAKEFTEHYYGEYYDKIMYADQAEVALTGFYPGWDEQIQNSEFIHSVAFKALEIDMVFENNVYYMYFKNGSEKHVKFFTECEEFIQLTNELVMRSALSVIIRGGFVNLLKAALSTEMPIKGFYKKLIVFADEIGSKECSTLLKSIDYENKVFEKTDSDAVSDNAPSQKNTIADKRFKIEDDVLIKYSGDDEIVTIPDGVKVIGEKAFYSNTTIKKVIIPDSVTQIKKCAFQYCGELQEVVLGKNISSFGNSCFTSCRSLAFIDFSNTKVKTLSKGILSHCANLKSLDLSKTKIIAIKEDAFNRCGIKTIILPPKLQSIGSHAFGNVEISDIVIPATVKDIDSRAFEGNTRIRIMFEGSEPINFNINGVGLDCIIVCKKESALMKMFEEQNEYIVKRGKDYFERYGKLPTYDKAYYTPRKIEEL
ncbi:MAG: leucine-rich repeat domain-containing protein [Lachnospiraceae bacterium]|nr:leucine-rich repeat domain-containing protein [Lachnospiraceae bacterium]